MRRSWLHDVLQRRVDRLRESRRAEDLFHSLDFLAVNGQTSLVPFGYGFAIHRYLDLGAFGCGPLSQH